MPSKLLAGIHPPTRHPSAALSIALGNGVLPHGLDWVVGSSCLEAVEVMSSTHMLPDGLSEYLYSTPVM